MLANRVREFSLTVGTGDVALGGAMAGHIRFADAFTPGDSVIYVIEDGDNYEIGTGTYQLGNTLARTSISETLQTGVLTRTGALPITLSGQARIYCAATAEFLLDPTEAADVITEVTPGAGVTVDGVLLKDGDVLGGRFVSGVGLPTTPALMVSDAGGFYKRGMAQIGLAIAGVDQAWLDAGQFQLASGVDLIGNGSAIFNHGSGDKLSVLRPGNYATIFLGRDASNGWDFHDTSAELHIRQMVAGVSLDWLTAGTDLSAIFSGHLSAPGITVTGVGSQTTFDSGALAAAQLDFKRNGVLEGFLSWDLDSVTLSANGGTLNFTDDASFAGQVWSQNGGSISGVNLSVADLLAGTTSDGIGLDNNEITKKGGDLHIQTHDTHSVHIRTNDANAISVSPSQLVTLHNEVAVAGNFNASSTIRATSIAGIPSSGAGIEMRYNPAENWGGIIALDRTLTAYKDLRLEGSLVDLRVDGVSVATASGTLFDVKTPMQVGGQLLSQSGSAALPGLSFAFDPNSGFYRSSENVLGVATGGVERASISSTLFDIKTPMQVAGDATFAGQIKVLGAALPQIRLNTNATDLTDADRAFFAISGGAHNFITGSTLNDTVLRGRGSGKLLLGVGTDGLVLTLASDKSATFAGDTQVDGKLNVFGPYFNMGGGYGATGVTINDVGNISANGTLIVDGDATLGGDVTIGFGSGALINAQSSLVLDGSTHHYLTFAATNVSSTGILFADDLDNDVGSLTYSHSTNIMNMVAGATSVLSASATLFDVKTALNVAGKLEVGLAGTQALKLNNTTGATTWLEFENFNNGDYFIGYGSQGFMLSPDTSAVHLAVDAVTGDATFAGLVGVAGANTANFNIASNQLVIGDGLSNSGVTVHSNGSATSYLVFNSTGTTVNDGWIGYNHLSDELYLVTNGTEALRLTAAGDATFAGDVGIGGSPSWPLHVQQDGITTNLVVERTGTGASKAILQAGTGSVFVGSLSSSPVYVGAGGIAALTINPDLSTTFAGDVTATGTVKAGGMFSLGTATTLTIALGAITVTKSFHEVDTEAAAATDDLDTINGGTEGDILVLSTLNSARNVTAKDGTGNLVLAGDCILSHPGDTLTMIYDGVNWREICRSDNSV